MLSRVLKTWGRTFTFVVVIVSSGALAQANPVVSDAENAIVSATGNAVGRSAGVSAELLIFLDAIQDSMPAPLAFRYQLGTSELPSGWGNHSCLLVSADEVFDYLLQNSELVEGLTQKTIQRAKKNLRELFQDQEVTRCDVDSLVRYYDSQYTTFANRHFEVLFEIVSSRD